MAVHVRHLPTPDADSQAAPTPGQQALSQRGLRDRPGVGHLHLPRGAYDLEVVQDGYPDRQNGSHPPTESLLVRRGGLRSVSAKRAVCGMVCGIRKGQRSDGATSSAGSDASVGSCVAEERRVCRVSSAASGGGAQVSASGTAWSEAGAVLRTYQDSVPSVDGSDGGQSDTGGWQSWEDGRNLRRNHLWAR